MRTYDLTPLHRFAVGFDRMQRLLDSAQRMETQDVAYPPYNIEQSGENDFRVTMAVAGFTEGDLDITLHDNTLIISGKHEKVEETDGATYLHRGIAARNFERRFELADHIQVKQASLANGLLTVELERVIPEEKQPKKIAIAKGSASEKKTLTHDKAA